MSDKPRIRVTQIRGTAGTLQNQRQSLLGLGLKRRHQTRELEDTPAVRGMIRVVEHLVRVEPVE